MEIIIDLDQIKTVEAAVPQKRLTDKQKKIVKGIIILAGVAAAAGIGAYTVNSIKNNAIAEVKPTSTPLPNSEIKQTLKNTSDKVVSNPTVSNTIKKEAISNPNPTPNIAKKIADKTVGMQNSNVTVMWNGQRVNPNDVHGDALKSFAKSIYSNSARGYQSGTNARSNEIYADLANFGAKFITDEYDGHRKLNLKDPRTKEIWDAVVAVHKM